MENDNLLPESKFKWWIITNGVPKGFDTKTGLEYHLNGLEYYDKVDAQIFYGQYVDKTVEVSEPNKSKVVIDDKNIDIVCQVAIENKTQLIDVYSNDKSINESVNEDKKETKKMLLENIADEIQFNVENNTLESTVLAYLQFVKPSKKD